jgi:threonine dehydratase
MIIQNIPTFADIEAAAARIAPTAIKTPLLRSALLDELTGASIFLKAETLQRTGSFKFRGAYNAISALDEKKRQMGVVAVSSGNHAQGVAEAARLLGAPATIIMPNDAPAIKIARTRRSGAEIILYDRMSEDRDVIVAKWLESNDAHFIHPFNDPLVISGQGTCGLEIAMQMQKLDKQPDAVFVCTGGGGLTAGIALAMQSHFPNTKVHSCEPEGFDDYKRSLIAGERLANAKPAGSVCDAIVTPMPGEISFAINRNLLGEGQTVNDQEALGAVAFAFNELKLVVEPGGAVALAAVLKAGKSLVGKTIVAVLSGGNIDPEVLSRALVSNG